jgi:hypothetical protein
MKTLTKQDMLDYVTGATILGCGGGGGAEGGIRMINEAFDGGYEFKLADLSELPDDDILCIVAGVGGGVPQEVRDKVAHYAEMFPRDQGARLRRLRKAAKELSDYIGKEVTSFIAAETGGGNGVLPMYLNALEGKPSVDADCCGRAKPEMGMSLTAVAGMPITPLAMVTPFMETVILKSAVDDIRAEDITRHVAVASGGGVTVARCPGKVKDYRRGTVPKIVSNCIKIGAAIREAKAKGGDPREAFIKASGAVPIFEGKVSDYTFEGTGGFNWGEWFIDGDGEYAGKKMKVWFKNEHLVSWLDDEPYVMGPDLICILERDSFEPLSNFIRGTTHAGKEILVYGIPADDEWKNPKGIELFGPRHFGFDIDYVPMKK